MRVVQDKKYIVPAGGSFHYDGPEGHKFNVYGPGEVHFRAVEFGERRTGAATRRARDGGKGNPRCLLARRGKTQPQRGRRSGDVELHQERRGGSMFSLRNSHARRHQGLPMRRKGDERRTTGVGMHYTSSRDPRVRALERRGKPIDFGRPFDWSECEAKKS